MTSAEGYKTFDNKSSFAKLLFLAVISIALCSFTPLTFLAPVPLTILALLYGRPTVIVVGLISLAAIFGASSIINFPALISLYAVSFVYALLISEVIYRGINPTTGLLATGLSVFAITMGIFATINFSKPMYIKSMMTELVSKSFEEVKVKNKKALEAGTPEAKELKEILEKPEKMVADVYNNSPAIVFVGVFLGIWLSFFVTLRNAKVWRYKVLYNFGLKDLLRFKVPENVVWLLIIGLAVYLGADYGLGTQAEIFGSNVLGCLAVLYFFQGFGIYNDYMAFLKMGPFLRMILTTFTVLFAWKMLVAVGVFDLWFNFRKFIKKQNGEGDKI